MDEVSSSGVTVGRVERVDSHPRADRIFVARVSVGWHRPLQIVFGGCRMIAPGTKVAVALPGTRLPSGDRVRRRRYRGVDSEAEILSSDELGWTRNGPDAVFVIDDIYPEGTPLLIR